MSSLIILRYGSGLGVAAALGGAFLAFAIVLAAAGVPAGPVLWALLDGAWGSRTGWSETVVKAVSISLCALAAAIPGRFGLINIGGEGQFVAGAIGASFVALNAGSLPAALVIPVMMAAAIAAGGAWASIPGWLRARTRTSETVVSLLLNYVAAFALLHLVHGPWRDPAALGWAQSPVFPDQAQLSHFPGTRIHLLLPIAAVSFIPFALLARYGTVGVTARILRANPDTARYARLDAGKYFVWTFVIGGAFAGLAGFGEVAGIHGRLREGVSLGYGFSGFLAAWLCRHNFHWIPIASLVIGGLLAAGDVLQISLGLPFATVRVLEGLTLLAIVIHHAVNEELTWRLWKKVETAS